MATERDHHLSAPGPEDVTSDQVSDKHAGPPDSPSAKEEARTYTDAELQMTPSEAKRLLRKVDIALVPYFSLLYLLSFLDRINIGQSIF